MKTLVLVSGQPGVGKTTLARPLAQALGLPLLEKDTIKDALLATLGAEDGDASKRLSAAAFEVLWAVAARLDDAIVEGNFKASLSREYVRGLHPAPVEVFCHCDPDVALARFRARVRHPGHADDEMLPVIERRLRTEQQPLGVGPVLEVDTGEDVDVDGVAAWVRAHLVDPPAAPR